MISADKTELRMTARQLRRATEDTPRYTVESVEITVSFTNVSDKPIKLNVYDLVTTGLQPDVVGPDDQSVRIVTQRLLRNHMAVAGPQDFPTIDPGGTWTCRETYSFPSDMYFWVVRLLKPGEFRVRLVYSKQAPELAKNAFPFMVGAWSGTLMSSEIVFKAFTAPDAK
jgi:hypothetical protein